MKIIAFPRFVIQQNIDKFEKCNVISILNGDEEKPILNNALTLFFDDISPTHDTNFTDLALFNINQANQILNYLEYLIANKADHVFVHCSAGVCRSGAVAKFIAYYLSDLNVNSIDLMKFHNDNPNILPNLWVESLLWYVVKTKLKGIKND